ncbi:MAG: hypothetical protein ABS913_09225 [Desemzia incerta]|uniref:hypothetical protein n=1 Tax=Desemzia incerta TaxID=82801 RepID=UPI00331559D9
MNFSFKGLDHIQITAPLGTEKETRHFFTEILGCQEIEKPESLSHFESLWFDTGKHVLHVGLDKDFHAEKRGHPAFEIANLVGLMDRLTEYNIPFEEDYNLPGARRFYTYAFFGHRMEFLEWHNKPESMMTDVEKSTIKDSSSSM